MFKFSLKIWNSIVSNFYSFQQSLWALNLEYAGQTSEELERRIGMMETSLNRFGTIMDSVQSDIMQVNKGTKEALMESKYLNCQILSG